MTAAAADHRRFSARDRSVISSILSFGVIERCCRCCFRRDFLGAKFSKQIREIGKMQPNAVLARWYCSHAVAGSGEHNFFRFLNFCHETYSYFATRELWNVTPGSSSAWKHLPLMKQQQLHLCNGTLELASCFIEIQSHQVSFETWEKFHCLVGTPEGQMLAFHPRQRT